MKFIAKPFFNAHTFGAQQPVLKDEVKRASLRLSKPIANSNAEFKVSDLFFKVTKAAKKDSSKQVQSKVAGLIRASSPKANEAKDNKVGP